MMGGEAIPKDMMSILNGCPEGMGFNTESAKKCTANAPISKEAKVADDVQMMGGVPTKIDMSKINQCRPGFGFNIPGVMKCTANAPISKEAKLA